MAEITIPADVAGTVWKIQVTVGQAVQADEELMILESMKMEIPVLAEHGGTVTEVRVTEGDVVQEGDVLVVLG